jgi:hypothetical protein
MLNSVEQVALVPPEYDKTTIRMYSCNLMSLVQGAMKSSEGDICHVRRAEQVQGVTASQVEVPVATLTAILSKHKVRHIDVLSLDVEGFEAPVLRGLDFSRYRPRIMIVEARFRKEVLEAIPNYYNLAHELGPYDLVFEFDRLSPVIAP